MRTNLQDWKHQDGTVCDAGFLAPRPTAEGTPQGHTPAPGARWWCTEHQKHLVHDDAETLRRAAARVREAAEKASPNVCPDWTRSAVRHIARNCEIYCPHTDDMGRVLDEHASDGVDHSGWDRYSDAPWIALMGPQVAGPLALWLEYSADEATLWAQRTQRTAMALSVASTLLGTEGEA